ncbi:hypothetical protein NEPTK9_001304 [Candidatus Neptunochlamydia vexilliferae]|uniref:Uncharacterized protein n=1 Tax=Candidatus Neptunichlamydia vexilliferae TaxID=1651774 RepID=A0ABS0B072_9BACT|nr:hypothetical protein [Candidatus Neptunochlamydia vexilliferae]
MLCTAPRGRSVWLARLKLKGAAGACPRRIFLTYTTDKCANFLPVKVNKAGKDKSRYPYF